MSRPVTIQWPVASTTAVCLAQGSAAAGALVINGGLASAGVATFPNIERTVSITSAGVATVQFTITGTLQGKVVSETRTGPNATTVYTMQKFTTVTSVTVNGALAANASVGTGLTGSTIWINSDYHRTNNALAVVARVINDSVTYTFETTFDDPAFVEEPTVIPAIDGITVPTIPAATPMLDATESILANYTIPTHSSRIRISASDAIGSAEIYFLQQGIR